MHAFIAVIAHIEFRLLTVILQHVEELVIDQRSVGIDLRNYNPAPRKLSHNILKIAAHQRLSAGQRRLLNAAGLKLINNIHDLLVGQLSELGLRCRHVAVPAAKVAAPGNGPVGRIYVAIRIEPVFLILR